MNKLGVPSNTNSNVASRPHTHHFQRSKVAFLIPLLLLLCTLGAMLIGISFAHPTIDLAVDMPTTTHYMTGFYAPEQNGEDTFRWSRENPRFMLKGFLPGATLLEIRMTSPRPPTEPQAETYLAHTSWRSDTFIVDGTWRRYQVLVPLADDDEHIVQLKTVRFAPGAQDNRSSIGVAVSHLRVTQLPVGNWHNWFNAFGASPIAFLLLAPLFLYTTMKRTISLYTRTPHLSRMQTIIPFLSFTVLLIIVACAAAFPAQSVNLLPTSWFLPYAMLMILALPTLIQLPRMKTYQPAWSLWVILLTIYIGITLFLPLPKGMTMTNGDEPHYLITAHSIYHDHDVSLVNNYHNKDYYSFYNRAELGRHLMQYKDRLILHHTMLGVPILIMPAYALGGLVGVRIFLNLLMATAIVHLYRASHVYASKTTSFICVLLLGITYPILIYSHQIYPEAIAFVLVAFLLAQILAPSDSHVQVQTLAIGCALGIMPHLNYKMVPLSVGLYAFFLWKQRKHIAHALQWSMGPILLFTFLFFFWFYVLFGELSPDILNHLFARGFPDAEEHSLLQGTLGLLFDQKFGLFFNAPLYLLAFFGLWTLWRTPLTRSDAFFITITYASYHILHASYVNWSSGGSPTPRYLVPILPILVIATVRGVATCWQHKQWVQLLILGMLQIWITLLIGNNRLLLFGSSDNIFFAQFNADTIITLLPSLRHGTPSEAYPRLALLIGVLLIWWYISSWGNRWFAQFLPAPQHNTKTDRTLRA